MLSIFLFNYGQAIWFSDGGGAGFFSNSLKLGFFFFRKVNAYIFFLFL